MRKWAGLQDLPSLLLYSPQPHSLLQFSVGDELLVGAVVHPHMRRAVLHLSQNLTKIVDTKLTSLAGKLIKIVRILKIEVQNDFA